MRSALSRASLLIPAAALAYALVVRGALTVDLRLGRRVRRLGPISLHIEADPEIVFDVIATPYLKKTPRAMRRKLRVLEQGTDLVLAEHFTPVGWGLTATTLETVRFERPHRVDFRLVRGPVPHVLETYQLRAVDRGTAFEYSGEMGTDLWRLGEWWASQVAPHWEATVAASLEDIRAEANRRASK